MARRVELGAGIVAATLAIVTFIVLLSVPLVAYCAVRSPTQPCVAVRRESLLTAGLDGGSWLYLCAMLALVLIASVGAVAEAGWGYRLGGPPLWICAALAFLGCVWAGAAVGIFFMPAVLAITFAAYASALRRARMRRLFIRRVAPRSIQQAEQQKA
ncbi:MAG TPA: hypothetical protein VGR88_07535 [Ktedonobacterales bacterium]|nr:hypothetical protein [Ktedonobacterales bacterium]